MRCVVLASAVCLVLSGCKEKVADTSAVVDAGAAKSMHAASPVNDTPTHDKGSIAPTDKPSEDQRAPDAGGAAAVALAEVEILGAITGAPDKSTTIVAVSKTECKANDAQLDLYGKSDAMAKASFFIEVFVPQGATGYLCVYSLRGGEVVAFGTGDKNPMKMEGHGEVLFGGTKVALKRTSKWKVPAALAPAVAP